MRSEDVEQARRKLPTGDQARAAGEKAGEEASDYIDQIVTLPSYLLHYSPRSLSRETGINRTNIGEIRPRQSPRRLPNLRRGIYQG